MYLIGTCYSCYYFPTAICSDLPPLINGGSINYSPSTTPRLEGATATYSCTDGYQLSSDTTRTCEDSVTGGRWNGMEPTCLGMLFYSNALVRTAQCFIVKVINFMDYMLTF